MSAILLLLACAPAAELSGSAGGITWGDTNYAWFGARYIVFSNIETDCEGIAFIDQNYDEQVAPNDVDTQTLQFTFDTEDVRTGTFQVAATDAEVHSTIVFIQDGAFSESIAAAGVLTVDEIDPDSSISGSFDTVSFEDGSVSGSFTAQWCRNLKP